jgi:hypothetical protein
MKILYLFLFSLVMLFTLSSCDQSLNPKGDYYERYVLDCILRGDTTYQVAVISHSYDVEGFDPYKNTTDPAIAGADLRLWYNDSVFVFRDSVVSRLGNTRYDDSLKIYYLNNIHLDFNKPIEIEALLQNGRRLKSSTTTAKEITFDNENSSKVIPPVNTSLVEVQWHNDAQNEFYLPRFIVTYYKKINGQSERHTIEMPIKYNQEGGNYVPVYPGASGQSAIDYNPDDIRRALLSISEGDPDKSNYSVLISNRVIVFALDQNLMRYYSANSQDNSFTVRLDESDYSNIVGGYGVFGSYIPKSYIIRFLPEFITDLGYTPVY